MCFFIRRHSGGLTNISSATRTGVAIKQLFGFCLIMLCTCFAWGAGAPLILDWGVLDTSLTEQQQRSQSVRTSSRASVVQRLSPRETAPWLVQFNDVIREEWKTAMVAAGAEIRGYMPENGFLILATPAQIQAIGAMPEVVYVGEFLPAYKESRPVREQLSKGLQETLEYNVWLFHAEDLAAIAQEIAALTGASVTRAEPVSGRAFVRVNMPSSAIETIAGWGEVEWIEPYRERQLWNDVAVRTNKMNVSNAWTTLGLSGAGQTIAVCDTGLDTGNASTLHPDFTNRLSWVQALGRIGDWSDPDSHGTHVAGSVLGNGTMSTGGYKGVAYEASLVFQSVLDSNGNLGGIPSDLNDLFRAAFTNGARIHSDSWGYRYSAGEYNDDSRALDMFTWSNKTMLVVMAAGNDGIDYNRDGVVDLGSVTPPGTAKNCLSVGASENYRTNGGLSSRVYGNLWPVDFRVPPIATDYPSQPDTPHGMAAFSGRGPCNDGRIKPDIVAPGTDIISTRSRASGNTGWGLVSENTNYLYMGGTSMATPLTAGAVALARQWLVTERGITDPSGQLLKALLLNGARNMAPGQYGAGAVQEIPDARPNNVHGWGHVDLFNALQPATNQFLDLYDASSLSTGQSNTYTLTVIAPSTNKFVLTMAYADYWGTVGSGKQLINDLDLTVQTPSGQILYANGGTGPDDLNNVEMIEFAPDEWGYYTVRVEARTVPSGGSQPYALVIRGNKVPEGAMPPPQWWRDREVVLPGAESDDYAAINLGQLKNMAFKAYEEMEEVWSNIGGAGPEVSALVSGFINQDNYSVANIGQLKAVAKRFYDRLMEFGLVSGYPWTPTSADDSDFSVANIGQLKNVFGFQIPSSPGLDSDGDGMPDWWELLHEMLNPNDPADAQLDPDEDGWSNLEEFMAGTDPSDPNSHSVNGWYVATNGVDAVGGGDYANPFATLTNAFAHAGDGQRVILFPGIYTGEGNRNLMLTTFTNRYFMTGLPNGRDTTVIDCENNPYFAGLVTKDFHIRNLTVRHASSKAIRHIAASGGVFLENCTFVSNGMAFSGYSTNLVIKNSLLLGHTNRAVACSGAFAEDSQFIDNTGGAVSAGINPNNILTSTFVRCVFSNNVVAASGGAIEGVLTIAEDCIFVGNQAAINGGAIFVMPDSDWPYLSGSLTANNCQFIGNQSDGDGGAIYAMSNSHPYISASLMMFGDCHFVGNQSAGNGGAVNAIANSSFSRCVFSNNASGAQGGSIYGAALLSAEDCQFVNSLASGDGGAVCATPNATSSFSRCAFSGNTTSAGSGGAIRTRASVTMENSLMKDNNAQYGGALHVSAYNSALYGILNNCTVVGNTSEGPAIRSSYSERIILVNCVVWSNVPSGVNVYTNPAMVTATNSCIQETNMPPGSGNISVDPLFASDGWRLSEDSPCRDAGLNLPGMVTQTDLDGNPRLMYGTVDMGAHEYGADGVSATHFVAIDSVNPVPPYASWVTAATSIQQALDVASPGALVLVSNGVYSAGSVVVDDSMPNRIALTNSVTVQSVNGAESTVILGQGPRGSYAVRCAYIGNDSTLQGFTLRGGHTYSGSYNDNRYLNGGGAWIEDGGHLVDCIITNCRAFNGGGVVGGLVQDCLLVNNKADSEGGGVYGSRVQSSVLIGNSATNLGGAVSIPGGMEPMEGCTFDNNRAGAQGGAIYVFNYGMFTVKESVFVGNRANLGGALSANGWSGLTVEGCVFETNEASGPGGVVYLDGTSSLPSVFKKCRMTGNEAQNGGAIFVVRGSYSMENCLLSGNTALAEGGALYVTSADYAYAPCVTLNNCTIIDNESAAGTGGAIGVTWNQTPYSSKPTCHLANSILWANSTAQIGGLIGTDAGIVSATNCCIQGPFMPAGTGNISVDPLLECEGWHLLLNSPCRDAGLNLDGMEVQTDLDGNARILFGTVDMGAHELTLPVGPSRVIRLSGNFDYGAVPIGDSAQANLTIHNNGDTTLTVTDIELPAGFSVSDSQFQVSPCGSKVVVVTFAPGAILDFGGTISVICDFTIGENTVECSGEGLPPGPAKILIPAGTNSGTDPDEGPYSLSVVSFLMEKDEVTKGLWDEVKDWNGGNGYSYDNAGSSKAANHPVQTVNWYDVVKWCNARSQKEGRTPVYYTDANLTQTYKTGQVAPYVKASANGYRLPTKVEWEYAARGGAQSHRFPWSDVDAIMHCMANYYSDNAYSYDWGPTQGYHPNSGVEPQTMAVGSFASQGYGLRDMAGNVWEWCYDSHSSHVGLKREIRGGSFSSRAISCQVAFEATCEPEEAWPNIGFRTVLPMDQ